MSQIGGNSAVNSIPPAGLPAWMGGSSLLGGLTHYWTLDEVSGVRNDSVGTAHLTDNNTVGIVNVGPSGVAANFVAANSESLSRTTGITASATSPEAMGVVGWVWLPSSGGTTILAVNADPTTPTTVTNTRTWQLHQATNVIVFSAFDASGTAYAATSAGLQTDAWHYVAGWVDANGKANISVDNAAAVLSALALASYRSASNGINFGSYAAGSTNPFNGRLARLAVWSRVPTAGERTSLFNAGNGKSYVDLTASEKVSLVSYWNLDEASGQRNDSHSTNHLTDNNTVGSATNSEVHPHNVGASFVQANSESLTLASIVLPDTVAVSFWWQPLVIPFASNNGLFYAYATPPNTQLRVYAPTGASALTVSCGDGVAATITASTPAISGIAWHHIYAQYDETTKKVSISVDDGVLASSAALPNAAYRTATGFWLGGIGGNYSTNSMDEVAMWSRVLTSDERTALYAAGAGTYYPTFA